MMLLNFVTHTKARPSPAVALAVAATLVVGASGVAYAVWRRATGTPTAAAALAERFYRVKPTNLDVTITQTGELQAVENIDLVCRVEGHTTITDIVKEGAYVKKDEVLIELDSQTIKQGIDDMTLAIQTADAAVSNAREMLAIQESNNAAETEGATVALQLAELDFKKYVEGQFPQDEKSAATKLDMANIDLQNKLDDLQQSKSLFTRGFVTAADVKKAELAVTQSRNGVEEAETALRVLKEYSHQADLAGKQNAVAQAKSKLERVKRQNESMIVQKQADLNAAEQQLQLRNRKLDELKEQLSFCTIRAPADGMVVYVNNPDNQQSVVQQGADVRERQPIIRLPDVSAMKAVMKLNEAQANRVQVGMRAAVEITGIPMPISGTVSKVSIVPVSGNRWMNPDSKDYPGEITLDVTPPNLKPSTTAKSTIMVKSLPEVLAVPLEAIYSAGYHTYVFVDRGDNSTEPREVALGESSMTQVQVRTGLKADERVLRLEAGQGKRLLDEAGVKIEPTSQPTAGNRGGGPSAAPAVNGGPPGAGGGAPGNGGERRRRGPGAADDAGTSGRGPATMPAR